MSVRRNGLPAFFSTPSNDFEENLAESFVVGTLGAFVAYDGGNASG